MNKLENLNNKCKKTYEGHEIIKNVIVNIDNTYKDFELLYNSLDNEYYRYLQMPKEITKYGYVTIIFCDSKYLPSILATGFYLKYILKTKYNIVCFVQDKNYHEKDIIGSNYIKFPGLNDVEINDIKKIYDVVIGIDLIKVNIEKRTLHNLFTSYKTLPYYCTKLLCLGLSEYSKLIYFDSTTLIIKNIDYLFDEFNKSTHRQNDTKVELGRGLIGNFHLFIPKKYYLYKGIYLTQNFENIFKNLESFFTKDEDVIYYTIYPHWNNKTINKELFRNNNYRTPFYNSFKDRGKQLVDTFVHTKPFIYPLSKTFEERTMYNINSTCYYQWDKSVEELLKIFPELYLYFNYIETFREVNYKINQ